MKTPSLVLVLLVLLSGTAFSQDQDSLTYRWGFLIDFETYTINQLGVKYRISSPLSLFLRARLRFSDSRHVDPGNDVKSEDIEFQPTVGVEYKVITISHVSLWAVLFSGVSLSRGESEYSLSTQPVNSQGHSTVLLLGAGAQAEYHFSEQLSFSAYQGMKARFVKTKHMEGTATYTSTDRVFDLVETKFTVTIYL